MDTETLDKLYLEWSQFTKARTSREIAAKYQMATARQRFADIAKTCAKNSSKASMNVPEAIGYERACADIEMLILESEPLPAERT